MPVLPSAMVLGLAMILPVGLWTCSGGGGRGVTIQSWAVGPSRRIATGGSVREETLFFDRAGNTIKLVGAVNETLAFQFVLSSETSQATGVELAAEDLIGPKGGIPASQIRMYRPWPVTIERYPNWYLRSQGLRQPREVLDVLVPLAAPIHGQPFVLNPGTRLPIWVEIRIPADASPGTFRGGIRIRNAEGPDARTPLEVTVRDIYLSPIDALPVPARVQLSPVIAAHTRLDPFNTRLAAADEEARQVLHRACAILQEHGLNPYTDALHPLFTQDRSGSVQLEWTDYDAFCGPLIDGSAYADGRPARAWPLPATLEQPDPARFGGMRAASYAAVLKDYLDQAAQHFEQNGWLDRAFVHFDLSNDAGPKTPAQNPDSDTLAHVKQLATLTHMARKGLPFVSTLIPQPMTAFGWLDHRFEDLSSSVDIWSTPARYQHLPTLRRLQTLGRKTWLLPDRPPFSGSLAVEAPRVHARSLPWQAFLQGHEAIALSQVTAWPENVLDEPIRDCAQPSDTWLLYPGIPFGLKEPVPSVRLKQLQLGLQEYQYLRLLDAHGRSETARLLAGSVIKAAGTGAYGDNYQDGVFTRRIDDAATWDLARSIMINEVAAALTETHEPHGSAAQAAWAKFLATTRRIEVHPESARLMPDDRSDQGGTLVRFNIAIRNELRVPLRGDLKLGEMPRGMRSVSDVVRVGPIPEMGLIRERVVLGTTALPPADLDGHWRQVIEFDAGASGTVRTTATVSVLQVLEAPSPITVDGRLTDWPPGERNIAGDFRLIGTQRAKVTPTGSSYDVPPVSGRSREGRLRAESQTVAYFCRDAHNLYIGIHAAMPDERRSLRENHPVRNFVEYEDLRPVGEDLVEILIDPTNAGTLSDDLYHIVLKATGNPIFERGIGTDPPIGRRTPWPGNLPSCCVVSTEYGWCAEISIPIATFGPQAARNPIWGVNLARLEPHRGEYSDWARAPRYCYDPQSLGNLVWSE